MLVACTGFGQKKGKSVKKLITSLEFPTPPSGIHIYDNVFMDETEVANIHWLEFLNYIKKDSSERFYRSMLPDSVWTIPIVSGDSIITLEYMYAPQFRFYPVVGISYRQAVNYCKWRSDMVNHFNGKNSKYTDLKKHYDFFIEFRLPNEEEWDFVASFKKLKSKETKSGTGSSTQTVDTGILLLNYIYFSVPNEIGIYGMQENCAEMLLTPGFCKGKTRTGLEATRSFRYSLPEKWLGFRCVAVAHIKRNSKSEK
jgi:hypothetical protein